VANQVWREYWMRDDEPVELRKQDIRCVPTCCANCKGPLDDQFKSWNLCNTCHDAKKASLDAARRLGAPQK
jgi:hypothetical protein